MNLLDEIVIHRAFGEGKITEFENSYVTVLFEDGEKRFVYPDAFRSFLVLRESDLSEQIEASIKEKEEQELRIHQERESVVKKQRELQNLNVKQIRLKKNEYPKSNIAFKCNYCNGGQTLDSIGFDGVCCDDIIKYNIEVAKHIWCSVEDSPCCQYWNGNITRKELEAMCDDEGFTCYESQMLRDWRAFAGGVQIGENKGKPMKLKQVQCNSLAVLTTREPNTGEKERFVFAVFLVDESYEGDNREAGYVTTSSEYKIKLSYDEATKIKFWDYYFNANSPEEIRMGHGLHRYLTDEQSAQILKRIMEIKLGTTDEEISARFYEHFCKINRLDKADIPDPYGTLKR